MAGGYGKKTLLVNPKHHLIQELLRRVSDDENDKIATAMALSMFKTGFCDIFYSTVDRYLPYAMYRINVLTHSPNYSSFW